jgi:hypothetical protein
VPEARIPENCHIIRYTCKRSIFRDKEIAERQIDTLNERPYKAKAEAYENRKDKQWKVFLDRIFHVFTPLHCSVFQPVLETPSAYEGILYGIPGSDPC